MDLFTKPEFREAGKIFWKTYELINIIGPPEISNKKELKIRSNRKCRYCGNAIPATTFNNDAHLIPELFGNKTLFCDDECDLCNETFGKYEDQLAKMIEIERPLHRVRGKKKFPGFKSATGDAKIQVKPFQEKQSIQISRTETDNDIISFDSKSGVLKIKLKRNPFIPNKVYKYFMKLALSVIPENEVLSDYKDGLSYILGKFNDSLSGCRVTGYYLPLGVKLIPHVYLFKKRDIKAKTHTHVIAFYFLNYIFSIPVLLNKNDYWFYNEDIAAINYPPLFVEGYPIDKITLTPFYFNFDSEEKDKLEDQEIFLEINKDDWENRSGFDTIKGQIINGDNFDPNSIVKIILMDKDEAGIILPISKESIE